MAGTKEHRRSHDRTGLLQVVQIFEARVGKFPARDDFKGERKKYYEELLGMKLPHARTFEAEFQSWQDLRLAMGAGVSKFTPSELVEKVSMDYAIKQLGMKPVDNETGTVDGYIGETRVEVKGATLSSMRDQYYRFRWQLHYRELSKLVDKLVLVGVTRQGEVAIVIEVNGKDNLEVLADKKRSIDFTFNTVFTQHQGTLWPFITMINREITEDQLGSI